MGLPDKQSLHKDQHPRECCVSLAVLVITHGDRGLSPLVLMRSRTDLSRCIVQEQGNCGNGMQPRVSPQMFRQLVETIQDVPNLRCGDGIGNGADVGSTRFWR